MKSKIFLFLFLISVVAGEASISNAEEIQVFDNAQLQQQVNQQVQNAVAVQQNIPAQNGNVVQQKVPANSVVYVISQPQQSHQISAVERNSDGDKLQIIKQKQQLNYVVDDVTSEQEEKDKKYEKSRFGITIGYAKQNYAGEYKDEARFFQNLNGSTGELLSENRYVDASHSVNIGFFYDKIANIYALINPFLGLEANINIPVSLQNDYDFRFNDANGTKYYTEDHRVGYLASNILSNFVDVKARIGNVFRFGENFNISVYASAGFASALYGHDIGYYRGGYKDGGYSYIFTSKDNPDNKVSFLAGYTYGAGVDIVLAKHYLIGCFYEVKKMLTSSGDNEYSFSLDPSKGVYYYNPVSKYENRTIGIRIGLVF